jgi:prevent-host-death family protein
VSDSREISQRDLRTRSKEIMDAVEHGERFTVTRDGRGIAQLIPLASRRTFVPYREFMELGRSLTTSDPDQLRAAIDAIANQTLDDPYER